MKININGLVVNISDSIIQDAVNIGKIIIKPNWWYRNTTTTKAWDQTLKNILENEQLQFSGHSYYHVNLNGFTIWIANYPYDWCSYESMLPSRTTAILFEKKLNEWLVETKMGRLR